MSAVTREHLAGLKLARECVGYSNSETSAWDKCDELDELIAQASAAPEQEAVEALPLAECVEHRHPGYGGGYFGTEVVMLYTHADPNVHWQAVASEQMTVIERLRAEIKHLESAWHVDVMRRKDDLIASQERENDRVKKELADAQALLKRVHEGLEKGHPLIKVDAEICALLSATAQPAEHDSDCSTNNRGVPELLGPCDCKGVDQ